MDGVAWRQKEIQYASRMDQQWHAAQIPKAVRPPAAQPGMRRHSWFAARLAEEVLGRRLRNIDIHTITYRHTGEESSFSDAEFSAGSTGAVARWVMWTCWKSLIVQAAEQAAQRHPADTRKGPADAV